MAGDQMDPNAVGNGTVEGQETGEDLGSFEKHPLLFGGSDAFDEEEREGDLTAEILDDDEEDPAGNGTQGQQEQSAQAEPQDDPFGRGEQEQQPADEGQKKPVAVLKHGGKEVEVFSEEDLRDLAERGLDYTQKTMAIAPYRRLVEAINNNSQLAKVVEDYLQGKIKPDDLAQAAQAPEETPPDQGEDETWEEYQSRLTRWHSEKAVQKALSEDAMKRQRQAEGAKQAAVVESVQRDPAFASTMKFIVEGTNVPVERGGMPASVVNLCKQDADAFLWLFNHAKRMAGGGAQQNPPAASGANRNQARTRQADGATQRAPFTESGKRGSGSPAKKAAIQDMSDEKFEALLSRIKMRR